MSQPQCPRCHSFRVHPSLLDAGKNECRECGLHLNVVYFHEKSTEGTGQWPRVPNIRPVDYVQTGNQTRVRRPIRHKVVGGKVARTPSIDEPTYWWMKEE